MELARVSRELAIDVASRLDQANVPNLLFGWLALALAGSPVFEILNDIDFIIPDAQMRAAIEILVAAGYPLCTDTSCSELHFDRIRNRSRNPYVLASRNRFHPVPAAHFHLESGCYLLLSLHVQTSLLWWLPELQPGPPAANDPDLILSNDPRLAETGGLGPWTQPVRVLNPNSLTEAVIMLWCRDRAREHILCSLWTRMTCCLGDAPGESITKQLRPQFQLAWDCLHERIPIPIGESVYREIKLLCNRLAWANELGPLIDGNTWQEPDD